jgi:predicted RNA-binding Zn-ribbon protein involved in translation (DUF1610 family)
MKRMPLRKISKKRAKELRKYNKEVLPAYKLGITVCPECGKPMDFRGIHRSHIKARALGGDNSAKNNEYKCANCHFTGKHGIREA